MPAIVKTERVELNIASGRVKHIEIKYHFVKDLVLRERLLKVYDVDSNENVSDLLISLLIEAFGIF